MLAELNIESLLLDDDLADDVWAPQDAGEISTLRLKPSLRPFGKIRTSGYFLCEHCRWLLAQ